MMISVKLLTVSMVLVRCVVNIGRRKCRTVIMTKRRVKFLPTSMRRNVATLFMIVVLTRILVRLVVNLR